MSSQNMVVDKCQPQKQSKHQVRGMRTAHREKVEIWHWTLPVKQPKSLRVIVENQNAPDRFAVRIGSHEWRDDSENFLPA
jgi:hypothetical protein